MTTKPARHSLSNSPQQGIKEALAVASVAFPPPPLPASVKKKPVKLKKIMPVERKKVVSVKTKMPVLKSAAAQAVKNPSLEKNQAPTIRVSTATSSPNAKEGRILLRLLEHGSGPAIGLAWPEDDTARELLYRLLRNCYGMKTALMNADGALYSVDANHKWRPDLDRYSGFVRQSLGIIPAGENKVAQQVRRRHHLGTDTTLVRLFPRRVDAVLLGGLQSLIGERYRRAKIIRAAYRQRGQEIFIDNIMADGAPVPGQIAFSAAQEGCG